MSDYELTTAAETDLRAIAWYTISTRGVEQADRYEALLESHFRSIGDEKVRTRVFLKHRPELRVSRCEHH